MNEYLNWAEEPKQTDLRKQVRKKATSVRASHARKYGMTPNILKYTYQWTTGDMIADIYEALGAPCYYCRTPITFALLTLDVSHPDHKPYYRTNTRWICRVCNLKKQRKNPGDFLASQYLPRRLDDPKTGTMALPLQWETG